MGILQHNRPAGYIRYLLICAAAVLLCHDLYAQDSTREIRGRVCDETDFPLAGAAVMADGSKEGTVTDGNGHFSLSVPDNVRTVTITYLGYLSQTVSVSDAFMDIRLKEDLNMLEELVVVGYGKQKKETLTGSISVVDSKSLVASPAANISNALVGRVPGIVSTQLSGEAGNDATTIRIRGIGTFNSSGLDPLIVIDGIESNMSTLNALDPNEIESLSVLKDASSTAVYGVRGANGVIIVTTKRGETGKVNINFTYRFGLSQMVSMLKPLGAYEYALYRNEAIMMDSDTSKESYFFDDIDLWKFRNNRDYTPDEIEMMVLSDEDKHTLLTSPALYYRSHDYINELFGGLAPQQQYNINISGGGKFMKYFVSMGYYGQEGAFQNAHYMGHDANSTYDRYNIRSNLDITVSRNTDISVDFGGQITGKSGILGSENDGDPTGNYSRYKAMLVNILCNTPFVGPGIVDDRLITAYSTSPLQNKGGYGYSPMTAILTSPILDTYAADLNVNARINHRMDYLTEGLTLSGTVSYNGTYSKSRVIWGNVPTYTMYRNPDNPLEYIYSGGVMNAQGIEDGSYRSKWRKLYLEAKLDYARSFGKHDVTGMILMNAQKVFDPSLAYQTPAGLVGIAARATYQYDERYLAEFNMGYNGSENFPEGERFGFFPAFSIGWIITNEPFFPKNDWLTWLKIRGSYGEVGNDKIGGRRFLYLADTWGYMSDGSVSNGYYFGNTDGSAHDPYYQGAYENVIGNPDVTWEVARKYNLGLEMNLFSDRLQFTGDLFLEKRDNILWNLGTVPGIVAADLPPANIGKMTNQGYELTLKWQDHVRYFNYAIGFNVSYAENRIDYMDEPAYPYEWMNTTGFSYGQYKGYRTDGFYNNQAEASNRPFISKDGNKVQAGDFRYVDIDGDGVINANDMVPIGYSNLPRYQFSSTIDLEYKGFSVSLLFTGSYKGSMKIGGSEYITNPFYMNNGAALDFQYYGRWTPEKAAAGIEPTFPRASMRTYDSQNGAMNDKWLFSTQFIRLKNAEIGYAFTNLGRLEKAGISQIRLFLNGTNLLTFLSDLPSGFDPELQDSDGSSGGYLYPLARTYSIGVNIQF